MEYQNYKCICIAPRKPRKFKQVPINKNLIAIARKARGSVLFAGETVLIDCVRGECAYFFKLDKNGNKMTDKCYLDNKRNFKFL